MNEGAGIPSPRKNHRQHRDYNGQEGELFAIPHQAILPADQTYLHQQAVD